MYFYDPTRQTIAFFSPSLPVCMCVTFENGHSRRAVKPRANTHTHTYTQPRPELIKRTVEISFREQHSLRQANRVGCSTRAALLKILPQSFNLTLEHAVSVLFRHRDEWCDVVNRHIFLFFLSRPSFRDFEFVTGVCLPLSQIDPEGITQSRRAHLSTGISFYFYFFQRPSSREKKNKKKKMFEQHK